MKKTKNKYSDKFKAKIALEAIKGESTLAELSNKYNIHSTQILRWKKQALEGLPNIFSNNIKKVEKDSEDETDELYKKIGQQKVELDWLKKKSGIEY